MRIDYLLLLFTLLVPSWAFKPGQLLKSYTINSYESPFPLDFNDEMIAVFEAGSTATLRLVGQLKEVTGVAMTTSPSDCRDLQGSTVSALNHISDEEASVRLVMPSLYGTASLYFCLNNTNEWVHQGSENWARVIVSRQILSLPLVIFLIILCLILSGTLSGLILALMSWDSADLSVVAISGVGKERVYGRLILSARKQGNFLLISLAVGATCLNSVFTVLINMLISEWMTVICATLAVVSCCEIIPDLIVTRYGFIVGAVTIFFTWSIMIMTSPLSYPIGKILDKLVGGDVWAVTRNRLRDVAKGLTDGKPDDTDPTSSTRPPRTPRTPPDTPEGIISEMSTGGDEGPTRKSYYRGNRRPRGRSSLGETSTTKDPSSEPQNDGDQGPVSFQPNQVIRGHNLQQDKERSQEDHPTNPRKYPTKPTRLPNHILEISYENQETIPPS